MNKLIISHRIELGGIGNCEGRGVVIKRVGQPINYAENQTYSIVRISSSGGGSFQFDFDALADDANEKLDSASAVVFQQLTGILPTNGEREEIARVIMNVSGEEY